MILSVIYLSPESLVKHGRAKTIEPSEMRWRGIERRAPVPDDDVRHFPVKCGDGAASVTAVGILIAFRCGRAAFLSNNLSAGCRNAAERALDDLRTTCATTRYQNKDKCKVTQRPSTWHGAPRLGLPGAQVRWSHVKFKQHSKRTPVKRNDTTVERRYRFKSV